MWPWTTSILSFSPSLWVLVEEKNVCAPTHFKGWYYQEFLKTSVMDRIRKKNCRTFSTINKDVKFRILVISGQHYIYIIYM